MNARTASGVVVGVDGTAASGAALRFAMREVARRDCGLDVISCWVFDGTDDGVSGPQSPQEAREAAERLQDEAVSAALDQVAPPAMISRAIVEGAPGPALVRAARGADLLVVGTTHRGPATRASLGSVSQFCVLRAPIPVTVVPDRSPAEVPHRDDRRP